MSEVCDAVVIGAGHNGLVAANLLADAGWDILVLEAADDPGGAVRSTKGPTSGFVFDHCAAFFPLAAVSPPLRSLELDHYGLRWRTAPRVLAHPLLDGRTAVLHRDPHATAESVDEFGRGDGRAWLAQYERWQRLREPLVNALLTPFPPLRAAATLARRLGAADGLRFARFAMLPVRRFAAEEFAGAGAPLLMAGSAMHADLAPDTPLSSVYGWILTMVGQDVGFPVPEGGAGSFTNALIRRLTTRGGRVECGHQVDRVVVRHGVALGVTTTGGRAVRARRAVLADVVAPVLFADLVGADHLPTRLLGDLQRFRYEYATVKIDWALSGPIPWTSDGPKGAGTVHLGGDLADLSRFATQLAHGEIPAQPFVVMGQMTTADPSRSPDGTESAWGYTHVPGADWHQERAAGQAARVESLIEAYAPGFRERVIEREVTPLPPGTVNQGTAQIHQQLIFRPVPGLGRPETPIERLFLAGASAHPGGGVHGACGANAAAAALLAAAPAGRTVSRAIRFVLNRLY